MFPTVREMTTAILSLFASGIFAIGFLLGVWMTQP